MTSFNLKNIATVSAVALCFGLSSGTAWSAAYELDSGNAVNVTVTAEVLQTVDVTVAANVNFGNIGIHQDAADTAQLVMDPLAAVTEDLAGPARMVTDDNSTPVAGDIDLTGGFPDTDIHVTYTHNADLACIDPSCALSNDLTLVDVQDSMVAAAALTNGTGVQQGDFATEGIGTTTAGGLLSWQIGATIETVAGAQPYETGTYVGSFDMTLSY